MYQALNNRVIATPAKDDKTTASGIILAPKNSACVPYLVCYTSPSTAQLQDKVVYAEARYQNHQLPDSGPNGETYVIIPLDEILAIKA